MLPWGRCWGLRCWSESKAFAQIELSWIVVVVGGMGMNLQRDNLSPFDAVGLVVGALVAYELGKGRNSSPAAGETRPSDDSDSANQPTSDA